ncbi:MAG: hypothetical protein CVV32_12950 [Methanomicrobiales archaeon HGW-Methanomicrobiales-3]|jgi:hypothetical protein|nr:MAG: hypothetical protein CVV32_12950 [Methanomicrobiales archaeon HGW-Methanomicrobiales-3]
MHKTPTTFQGTIIQTKKAGTKDGALIRPDFFFEENGLSIFFYHWHNGRISLRDMDRMGLRYDNTDLALNRIWSRALDSINFDINIEKMKPGEIFSFYLEDVSYREHLIHTYESEIEKKKINISLCQMCKKAINIHLSRSVKYCPKCAKKKKKDRQQEIRAIFQGRGFCKYCGVPLKKSSQPIEYCSDRCRTYARRERERIEKHKESMEIFEDLIFG